MPYVLQNLLLELSKWRFSAKLCNDAPILSKNIFNWRSCRLRPLKEWPIGIFSKKRSCNKIVYSRFHKTKRSCLHYFHIPGVFLDADMLFYNKSSMRGNQHIPMCLCGNISTLAIRLQFVRYQVDLRAIKVGCQRNSGQKCRWQEFLRVCVCVL